MTLPPRWEPSASPSTPYTATSLSHSTAKQSLHQYLTPTFLPPPILNSTKTPLPTSLCATRFGHEFGIPLRVDVTIVRGILRFTYTLSPFDQPNTPISSHEKSPLENLNKPPIKNQPNTPISSHEKSPLENLNKPPIKNQHNIPAVHKHPNPNDSTLTNSPSINTIDSPITDLVDTINDRSVDDLDELVDLHHPNRPAPPSTNDIDTADANVGTSHSAPPPVPNDTTTKYNESTCSNSTNQATTINETTTDRAHNNVTVSTDNALSFPPNTDT